MTYWIIDIRKIVLLLLVFLSHGIYSQENGLFFNDRSYNVRHPKPGTFSFYENQSKQKMDLDSLLSRNLKVLQSSAPNFGFIQHDVWFRTFLSNKGKSDKEVYLVLSNPNLDHADLFVYSDEGKLISMQRFSDLIPLSKKNPITRKPTYHLKIPSGKTIKILLKVNNGGEQFHFDISFRKLEYHDMKENSESWFLGIFFGILMFTALLNLYMLVLTRELLSLYYSAYVITLIFLQGSLLGFGKLYFWTDSEYLTNHANPIFASASVLFLLLFSKRYLNLENILPRFDRIFIWIAYGIGLCIILSVLPFESSYHLSIILINGITLFLNLLILPVAWMVMRKGYKPAILFLIAFLILVFSVFAFILKNFGLAPSNFFTDFGFQIGSTMEVLLFSLGIIIRFRNVQKEAISRLEEINKLKDEANEVLEAKVLERTSEIEAQKEELEDKNSEILSSIAYARRIQEAILPDPEKIQQVMPGTQLFYQPKDIVSGDFYWIEEKEIGTHKYRFFAVADCTGHGVPGAMMSVLCHNVLNRCLEETDNPNPAEFLERIDELLKKELSKNQQSIRDGMDISLGILEPEKEELLWAGANNPLWILRNGELLEMEPVKRPIGLGESHSPFEMERIKLQDKDILFLFSDGIVDQFGGNDAKKLKKKQLREWILVASGLPCDSIRDHISEKFNFWKGETEQTDDVCLLVYGFHGQQ